MLSVFLGLIPTPLDLFSLQSVIINRKQNRQIAIRETALLILYINLLKVAFCSGAIHFSGFSSRCNINTIRKSALKLYAIMLMHIKRMQLSSVSKLTHSQHDRYVFKIY